MTSGLCYNCGEEFHPQACDVANGYGKYCSLSCSAKQNGIKNLRPRGEIDIAPFRERFIQLYNLGEIDFAELARRMGRTRKDTSYVQRMLGFRPAVEVDSRGVKYKKFRKKVEYDTAVKLADALGLDPIDVGI